NLCFAVETDLTPRALLARAQAVERAFGRERSKERRWGPRRVDIDLVAYDDLVLQEPDLTLPHPQLFGRAFVLAPLAEIAPDRRMAGRRVRAALAQLDAGGVEKLPARPGAAAEFGKRLVVGPPLAPWHFVTMPDAPADDLPLAAEFPAATRDQWRQLVADVLKGAPFDKRLVAKTYDGITIEPLYGRRAQARPIAGRAPAAPWSVMQRVDHPDPAAANAEALHDLENGATGLSVIFAGAIGAYGYGLTASEAAIARALEGIHLDAGI